MKSLVVCLLSLLVSVSAASAEAPIVSGQVRLVDGSAVAGASVVLFDVSAERLGMLAKTTTDASGQFALEDAATAAGAQPTHFSLGPSYPNPFNPATIIPYALAKTARVRLEVFNVLGQRVVTLVDAEQAAGSYAVRWNAQDGLGQGVASGVYIYRLVVGEAAATGRMVLIDGPVGAALPGGSLGAAVASGMVDAPDAWVESQVESSVYGLAVWGDGIETYADTAFVLGSGPVEVVLDVPVRPRGKVVQQDFGIGWDFASFDLLRADNRTYLQDEITKQVRTYCSNAAIEFIEQDHLLVYEMSLSTYDCFTGLHDELGQAGLEGAVNVIVDLVIVAGSALVTYATGGVTAPYTIPLAIVKALKVYSAISDAAYLMRQSDTFLERYVSSTRVGLIGSATAAGALIPGPPNVPILMVRNEKDDVRTVPLNLVKEYGSGNDERQNLGSIRLNPNKGYFIIPNQRFSLATWGHPLYPLPVRLELELDDWFYERDITFDMAKGHYYLAKFTAVESGDDLVLDASLSCIFPFANSHRDYPEPDYHWGYNNNTESWYRPLGSGPQLRVPLSSFDELVDGQGTVEIQLDVSRWDVTVTERSLVVVGEPEEPEEEPVPDGGQVGETFRDCAACPLMIEVPPGSFTMGSPSGEEGRDSDEGPQHEVRIGYRLAVGVYEVTFAEWDACVSAGGCNGYRPNDRGWGRGQRPVIYVSWDDAQSYVAWLSNTTGHAYRLLSESEWEYVARAGTSTPFHYGATISTDQANYNGNYTYGSGRKGVDRRQTVPVGSFPANAFGLHDVHGNVWEWTQDCWNGSYSGAPSDGSAWESGNCGRRVLRGGSWGSAPRLLRSAYRDRNNADVRGSSYGFRVSRMLTP